MFVIDLGREKNFAAKAVLDFDYHAEPPALMSESRVARWATTFTGCTPVVAGARR